MFLDYKNYLNNSKQSNQYANTKNMVICKFFLQGNCKYGNSCKFEHDQGQDHYNSYGRQTFTSPLSASVGAANKPSTLASNIDINALVTTVFNDMSAAEKGGQWIISSYAPFKEKAEFPGLANFSFEEIRHMYTEAVKSGQTDQYIQQWQNMQQQALMKVKALQNPPPEIIEVLKNIFNTPVTNNTFQNANQPATTTGHFQNTGIFASNPPISFLGNDMNQIVGVAQTSPLTSNTQQSQPVNNFFTTGAQNYNIFSNKQGSMQQSNSIFQNSQNVFQGGPISLHKNQEGNPQSIFQNATKNLQNNQQVTSHSIFQNPTQNTQNNQQGSSQSIFQNAAQNLQNNLQGNLQSIFQNPSQNLQNNQVINPVSYQGNNTFFTSQPGTAGFNRPDFNLVNINLYQQQSPSSDIFNSNRPSLQPSGIFNSQLRNANVYKDSQQPAENNASPLYPKDAFSNNYSGSSISGNLIQSRQQLDPRLTENCYSKLEDLSEADIKWFQTDDISLENIPSQPPTYELSN